MPGTIKAMYIMGENPLVTDPDLTPRGGGPAEPGLSGGAGHLPHRDHGPGRCGPAGAAPGPRRTAPSATPSAASSWCARPWSRPARPAPTGRSSPTWRSGSCGCRAPTTTAWRPGASPRRPPIMAEAATVTPQYAGIRHERLAEGRHPMAMPHAGPPGHQDPAPRQVQPGPGQVQRRGPHRPRRAARRRVPHWFSPPGGVCSTITPAP